MLPRVKQNVAVNLSIWYVMVCDFMVLQRLDKITMMIIFVMLSATRQPLRHLFLY